MWITIIGVLAAILTTIAFLPQVIKTLRTKKTKDLSLSMLTVQGVGNFSWFLYGILIINYPVLIANLLTFLLVASIWIMKIIYK